MYKFFQENIYANLTFFKTVVHNNERAHNSEMCNERLRFTCVGELKLVTSQCDRMHSNHCLPSCILARSDCASSAKSIAFDDCSDMSEKIIQVTVPS